MLLKPRSVLLQLGARCRHAKVPRCCCMFIRALVKRPSQALVRAKMSASVTRGRLTVEFSVFTDSIAGKDSTKLASLQGTHLVYLPIFLQTGVL